MLSKLREDGWSGVLVVMAEDEAGCRIVSEEKYQAIVLTKPFDLAELIAAIARNPNANSSLYFALSTPQVAQ